MPTDPKPHTRRTRNQADQAGNAAKVAPPVEAPPVEAPPVEAPPVEAPGPRGAGGTLRGHQIVSARHHAQLALLAALDCTPLSEAGCVALSPAASEALRAWRRTASKHNALGRALRALRLSRGVSQGELAPRANVSQSQLSRYEAGEGALPDAGALVLLLDGLNATADERAQLLDAAGADGRARRRTAVER